MSEQHVGQHEAFAASVAGVRPLPVVRLPVDPDVPGGREPLLTDFAGEPLLVGISAALGHLANGLNVTRRRRHHVQVRRPLSHQVIFRRTSQTWRLWHPVDVRGRYRTGSGAQSGRKRT